MRRSVFLKIIGGYFIIIFFLSVFIIIFTNNLTKHFYIKQLVKELKNSIILFQPQVLQLMKKRKYDEINKLAKRLGKETRMRITVIEPDGVVIADSESDPELMENHKSRPEVISALDNGFGKSIRYSSTVSTEMLYVALPLKDKEEIKGIIRMSLFLDDTKSLYKSLKNQIIFLSIIFAILSFFAVLFFTKRFTRSITLLSEASHRLAFGDYEVNLLLKGNDEIRDLSESFNFMAFKIKKVIEELKGKQAELDAIVNSISEGLLVVDNQGIIVLSNKSFKKISGLKKTEGKSLIEVFRSPDLHEAFDKFQKDKGPATVEIKYGDNFYVCNFTPVEGLFSVIIMHDISEIKRLEKIKREFVSNIAHELRTPLTAIKGFVETIEGNLDEANKSYIEIIKRNTDRVINIVKDLLVLSEVEDKEIKPVIEKVNLKGLLENISKLFNKQLEEKGLYLKITLKDEIPQIMGDYFQLEQLFTNLLDNAIKYTEKGGIRIDIEKVERDIKIEVEDTGIGISEEHLPRIFERFYVVDKSRSRKLGGTGLGLSIVKHIVLMHNGSINVESTPGKGTKFTIYLPRS